MPLARTLRVLLVVSALALAVPASASATDWTQFRSDAAQTGVNASETTLTPATVGGLKPAWSKPVGSAIYLAAPLVLGAKTIISADASISAFSTSTGAPLWSFVPPAGQLSHPIGAGGGRVFAQSEGGPVYALDASTGSVLWKRWIGGESTYSGAMVTGGVVYVPARTKLFALDAATGVTLWKNVADHFGVSCVSTPAVSGGLVVVTTFDGVWAFDRASGALVWSLPWTRGDCSSAAIVDGAVYAAAWRTEVKLDLATGAVIWRKTLQSGNRASSSPAVANGVVVVHVDRFGRPVRDIVTARSMDTGNVVWSVGNEPGNLQSVPGSSPVIAGGVVYVGYSAQFVRAFDVSNGKLLWEAPLDGPAFSSPSVANGQLEIGTFEGTLYAFRLP